MSMFDTVHVQIYDEMVGIQVKDFDSCLGDFHWGEKILDNAPNISFIHTDADVSYKQIDTGLTLMLVLINGIIADYSFVPKGVSGDLIKEDLLHLWSVPDIYRAFLATAFESLDKKHKISSMFESEMRRVIREYEDFNTLKTKTPTSNKHGRLMFSFNRFLNSATSFEAEVTSIFNRLKTDSEFSQKNSMHMDRFLNLAIPYIPQKAIPKSLLVSKVFNKALPCFNINYKKQITLSKDVMLTRADYLVKIQKISRETIQLIESRKVGTFIQSVASLSQMISDNYSSLIIDKNLPKIIKKGLSTSEFIDEIAQGNCNIFLTFLLEKMPSLLQKQDKFWISFLDSLLNNLEDNNNKKPLVSADMSKLLSIMKTNVNVIKPPKSCYPLLSRLSIFDNELSTLLEHNFLDSKLKVVANDRYDTKKI